MNTNQIGYRIKQIRKSASLTQAQLAEMLDTSTVNIAKIETGRTKPKLDMIIQITKIFRIDLNWLVFGKYR